MGIIGFDPVDPVDGIATAKREQRVAAPFGPLFETAERPTGFEVSGVLPAPSPDGQGRAQQLGPTVLNLPEEAGPESIP
jgi:hypothetical protein